MTEHAPISTIVPKSSANLCNSTPSAVHSSAASPLHNSLRRLVSAQPARPRHSNPHSARGSDLRPLRAVSSLGGFRTPAAECAAPSLKRPASETRHRSRSQPDYSITSLAPTSTISGMAMPSVLAVLRLTTTSKIAGCSMGRSPARSPLRTLSTKCAARR